MLLPLSDNRQEFRLAGREDPPLELVHAPVRPSGDGRRFVFGMHRRMRWALALGLAAARSEMQALPVPDLLSLSPTLGSQMAIVLLLDKTGQHVVGHPQPLQHIPGELEARFQGLGNSNGRAVALER